MCMCSNIALLKIPSFHLISWCGNFFERQSFRIVFGDRPKLCGNSAFKQNFHTSKLGEITVFFTVLMNIHLTGCDLTKTFNFQNYYFPEYHPMYHTGEESKNSILKFSYKKYFRSTASYYSSL